jgi:hypothetical protein
MKKFKKYYHDFIKESIFIPLTVEQVIERKKQAPGFLDYDGNPTGITLEDLEADVKSWDLYSDEYPSIDDVIEYLVDKSEKDNLYEKLNEISQIMTNDLFNNYDIKITADIRTNEYIELQQFIDNKCNISPLGHVYDDYLFITDQPMSIRKDNMEEDIDKIYSYTVSLGISKDDIRTVLTDSTYGGKVTIGLVGSVNTADNGYVEGYPMIVIGDAYMIGDRNEKLAGTNDEFGKMIDTKLGEELNAAEWTTE